MMPLTGEEMGEGIGGGDDGGKGEGRELKFRMIRIGVGVTGSLAG